MSELSPDARSLLEAARSADDPSSEDRARVRNKVALQVGVVAAGAVVGTSAVASATLGTSGAATSTGSLSAGAALATSTAATTSAAIGTTTVTSAAATTVAGAAGWSMLTKVVVAAAVVGASVTTAPLLRPTPSQTQTVATAPRTTEPADAPSISEGHPLWRRASETAPESTASTASTATTSTSTSTSTSTPGSTPTSTPRSTARTAPVSTSASKATTPEDGAGRAVAPAALGTPEPAAVSATISAELALLARAQRALRDGDPLAARLALQDHARRFADGALAEEREGLGALVACKLGEIDASARAQAFLARAPSSPLSQRIKDVCKP